MKAEWQNKSSYFVIPFFKLLVLSLIVFFINRIVDELFFVGKENFLQKLFSSDINVLANTLSGLGEVVTAVLGIEITAIAIVVQLAANKYSSNIMELFIENKVNILIIALFVITGTNTVLVTNTMTETFMPLFSITVTILLIALSVLIVIPHFSYVFNFLRPNNFLNYVKDNTIKIFDDMVGENVQYNNFQKDQINYNINFIGDIALNSVHQGDRAVSLLALSVLKEIMIEYSKRKKDLPEGWFKLTGNEYLDPDFSNYSDFVMTRIEAKQNVLERKIFRLYELIFNNSRTTLRDVASGVLLYSELIAVEFIRNKDLTSLNTVFKYYNSYLRSAITGKDPRSAFNAFEHYRIIGEKLLDTYPEEVEKVSFYFKYYGQEANKYSVLFILETAAHDLCRINELAFEKKVPNLLKLLDFFLNLDEPIGEAVQENDTHKELSLIGVRVAQAKLAGFYLLHGNTELAKIIYTDMKIEPDYRIQKIKETILQTSEEEFWEITPRGVNFNYVKPELRNSVIEFFSWFEKKMDNVI
ncbi:MAG: DUF2254 family protein [bacterium]